MNIEEIRSKLLEQDVAQVMSNGYMASQIVVFIWHGAGAKQIETCWTIRCG